MAKKSTKPPKGLDADTPLVEDAPIDVEENSGPGYIEIEDSPPENMPPIEIAHTNGEEKNSVFKQLNRPKCPMCGKAMHAVSSQVRKQDGAVTYYRCNEDECPEQSLLPVPRTEFLEAVERNKQRGPREIEQINVAAREDMKGIGG